MEVRRSEHGPGPIPCVWKQAKDLYSIRFDSNYGAMHTIAKRQLFRNMIFLLNNKQGKHGK